MRFTEEYLRNNDNPYLKTHKIFYEVKKYKEALKSWDREIYAYCRDRISLSLKNKWFNEKGEIYFKASQEKLSIYLGISRKTVNESFKKLLVLKLLELEKGAGKGNENVYYLCEIPELINKVLNVTDGYSDCNSELQSNLNVTDSYTNKTNIMYLLLLNKTYSNKELEEINKMIEERKFSEEAKNNIVRFIKDRTDRKKSGSTMTIESIKLFLNKLVKVVNDDDKKYFIDEAIEKGWLTIFPKEKGGVNGNNIAKGSREKPDYSEGW